MSSSGLTTIQIQMSFYGYPIGLVFGTIGNIFILLIFTRQRHNACSIYLMNAAVANLLYLTISGSFKIFSPSRYDTTLRALIICKISTYVPSFLGPVTKTMLVLACIDRYLITSDRATLRAFSTTKRAKCFILINYIFWAIAASHAAILGTVSNGMCTKVGIYSKIFTFYAIFAIGLIPSVILCVFGFLTYRNLYQMRNRIHPTTTGPNNTRSSIQQRDRNLLILVIAEVCVYIITTSLFPIINLEMLISEYALGKKSLQYIQAEVFVLNVSLLLIFLFSVTPFYIYMISSSSFRQDFKRLIINYYRKLRPLPLEMTAPSGNQTLPPQNTRI